MPTVYEESHSISQKGGSHFSINNVCVCVCVCVSMCILEGFFRMQDVSDIVEGHGPMNLCCEYSAGCSCQRPSSPYLKMPYFTSKNENSSEHKLERKRSDILGTCKKMIYIDIGYKSATH